MPLTHTMKLLALVFIFGLIFYCAFAFSLVLHYIYVARFLFYIPITVTIFFRREVLEYDLVDVLFDSMVMISAALFITGRISVVGVTTPPPPRAYPKF